TVLLLPRHPGEGTKLERDSSIRAKIENYQEGIAVLSRSPFIGHGYDNLDRIRTVSNPQSHSIYGFDSSLLTIAATTGVIGLIIFCLAVLTLYKTVDFPQKTLLVALLVHSLFANSMLYSWVIVFLIFTNLKSHK
ncbi:MAG TPA: O-antigen ligase family protein, partial [Patescibacteria group bacterium]